MTAEETALQQFRAAVANVRVARKIRNADTFGLRFAVASIARIIRAIRAERGQERRDALRGVQGACLFEEAASGDHSPDYYIALAVIADAAEEAAR